MLSSMAMKRGLIVGHFFSDLVSEHLIPDNAEKAPGRCVFVMGYKILPHVASVMREVRTRRTCRYALATKGCIPFSPSLF
jgi:hypothetical protein